MPQVVDYHMKYIFLLVGIELITVFAIVSDWIDRCKFSYNTIAVTFYTYMYITVNKSLKHYLIKNIKKM